MRITPIRTGTIHVNKSIITLGRDYDQWIDVPATAWLVETAGHRILVDTGMCSTEQSEKYHYPGSKQKPVERIDSALAAMRVQTDEIDTVIFTHLHWDHCSHCDLFSKAVFYVQKAEIEFALNPIPPYFHSYEAKATGLDPAYKKVSMRIIEGDCVIVPDVHVLSTPGHSPGHQSVLVRGERKKFVISGDAVMTYENLERDPSKGLEFRMIGRYMDFEKTWRSFEKIKKMADFVLPAHDFRVFDQLHYS